MEVTGSYVEVESRVRLYVADVGAGDCVVFLHGFPDGWELWTRQMAAVAEAGLRAVSVEQRGYRLSSQPRGIGAYRVARLAEDVAVVIRTLGYERASVVGHDWGGGVAWCFAMLFPELLERLVVINAPHPRRFVQGLKNFKQLRRSWYMALFQLPWLAERATGAPTGAVNWYRAMRFGGMPSRRIEHPVLVIWGDDDPFLMRELAEPDLEDVPNVQVVYLKVGHWVMRDAADEVSRLITGFLAKG